MKSLKSASALFKSTHAPTLILAMEDARLAPRGGLVGIYTIALNYKLIKPTKPQRVGRFEQVFPKGKCLA